MSWLRIDLLQDIEVDTVMDFVRSRLVQKEASVFCVGSKFEGLKKEAFLYKLHN